MLVPRLSSAAAGLAAASLAAAVALASTPASGQVSAAPLAQVDPWGVGWLSRNEAAPATIWSNTTTDALAPLFTQLQPLELSPASRAALRRIVLSGAKGPPDSNVLMPERLRIIEQLGETEHALELRKRFPDLSWGSEYERRASDYDLINDRKDAACSRISDKRADDADWMPVRAFCLALAGDFNGATLIGENLPSGPDGGGGGGGDAWLLASISAMDPAVKTRPEGRYANAFDAAVSVNAQLSAPPAAFATMPPDIAAAIVLHPNATPGQKRAALRPALDSPRIKPADVLAVLSAPEKAPATPAPRGQRAAPRVDFLALALVTANDADAKPEARSVAFAAALKGAETQADFRLAALALADAIRALPRSATNAETFARAALVVGDARTAADWRRQIDETADPWSAARIDLMLSFAGANAGRPGEILDRLVAAIPPAPETPVATTGAAARTAATPAARQLDLRRIETTRALFLYTGTGRALSPDQRALLFNQKAAGRGVSDAAIARIAAAADQNANGEAALAAISLMGADVSALSFAGLADLLAQLRKAGFEKEADAIALESLQVWKAI